MNIRARGAPSSADVASSSAMGEAQRTRQEREEEEDDDDWPEVSIDGQCQSNSKFVAGAITLFEMQCKGRQEVCDTAESAFFSRRDRPMRNVPGHGNHHSPRVLEYPDVCGSFCW